jgi:argininosuccinate lyase
LSRLWDKGGPLDDAVARLTVGNDPVLDSRLLRHDALASAAHATMLAEIGVLSAVELTGLRAELRTLAAEAATGAFAIDPADEEGHTAIENRLTARLGDAGRRIHTGRSRNDQVIAALRLWGREALLDMTEQLLAVVESLTALAAAHAATSVPGYSHTRQAMTTTLGHFFAAYADNLLDHLPWIETAWRHLDRSPLGSASGFGVVLALDRERVAELLGFDGVQHNTLAVQNDRGRSEGMVLGVAAAVTTDLGRLARDLIHYSSEALGFVRLGAETTTGSSIMPQKRNPDPLEIIRAAAARGRHMAAQVEEIYGGLGAGYHRDLQLTKEPFVVGLVAAIDCLTTLRAVLDSLEIDIEGCRAAILPATAATDAIYQQVARGVPFREAYGRAAAAPEAAYIGDPAESWRERTHAGAPGDSSYEYLSDRRRAGLDWLQARRERVRAVWIWFGANPD